MYKMRAIAYNGRMTTTRPVPVTFELSDIDTDDAVTAIDTVTRSLTDLGLITDPYVTDTDDGAAGEFVVVDPTTREVVVLATRALLTLTSRDARDAHVTVA